MTTPPRVYRAGQTVEDLCRACKVDRQHTVIVVESDGRPLRVQCDYCGSQHQFRGGPSTGAGDSEAAGSAVRGSTHAAGVRSRDTFPLVAPGECAEPPLTVEVPMHGPVELELLIRRIIREESGLTPVAPADKWRGGTLAAEAGNGGPAGEELADRDLLPQGRDAPQSLAHAGAAGERARTFRTIRK